MADDQEEADLHAFWESLFSGMLRHYEMNPDLYASLGNEPPPDAVIEGLQPIDVDHPLLKKMGDSRR